MKATLEYVKRKFAEYNDLCFDGKLKPLPIRISSARTYLGQLRFRKEQNPDGTWIFDDFEFVISNRLDLDERDVEDTILHEMIHYYIKSNQLQDTSSHGKLFRRMMKNINVRYNRNITISHKGTKEEHDRDIEVRQHLICAVRLKSNVMGVTVVTKSRLFKLWKEIPAIPQVAECNWYASTDPWFNRFPRATTVKIYPVPVDELKEHLDVAKPLEKIGNTIRIKNH